TESRLHDAALGLLAAFVVLIQHLDDCLVFLNVSGFRHHATPAVIKMDSQAFPLAQIESPANEGGSMMGLAKSVLATAISRRLRASRYSLWSRRRNRSHAVRRPVQYRCASARPNRDWR